MDTTTKLKFVEQMELIIRDPANLVEVANACDRAYAEGTGNPDWHSPFDEEKPEHVAMNLADAQAVMSGVGALCAIRNLDVSEHGVAVLNEITEWNLMPEEKDLLLRFANATWGAGQPFRADKGPLGRAGAMNMFDALPAEEVAKDRHQLQAAAKFFLKKMRE